MTPLDHLRLEKAAADCGFEMTTIPHLDGLELRSAHFPETVLVSMIDERNFTVGSSDFAILNLEGCDGPVKAEGYGELYTILRNAAAHARTKPNRVADKFRREAAALPKSTEAERLIVQRVGQGLFRDALLDYWQGKCCVTGLDVPKLLRASHIRPWAKCETDEQRLDVFNGLLLAPHLDALFDAGLMTIKEDGTIKMSSKLSSEHQVLLGLTATMQVHGLTAKHQAYLVFHRATVWAA